MALLSCSFCAAQVAPATLDSVVISASLSQQSILKSGRNVIVIKGQALSDLPVHSVDELLKFIPGIEVQQRGPLGAQSDILIRGGSFQQVLVMIDGVRLNDPNTGHFSGYLPIAPMEIDRIEIIKGPVSAIYGSEAVGGVINIITKTNLRTRSENLRSEGLVQITGGEHHLLAVNTGVSITRKQTTIVGGLVSNNTDGQLQRGTHGSVFSHTGSASINTKFKNSWSLQVRGAIDSRRFSAQNFYTNFLSDTATEYVRSVWTQAGISHEGRKGQTTFQVGFKDFDDQYQFNPRSLPNESNSKLLQGLITQSLLIDDKTKLASGLQFIQKKISSNDRGNHHQEQYAAFVVFTRELAKGFYTNLAGRLEAGSNNKTIFIPQLGLSYSGGRWQLRALTGRTVRDADFTERYNNYGKTLVTSGRLGNPDLEQERAWSFELGGDLSFQNGWSTSLTAFYRTQDQVIDYVNTPYQNIPRKVNLVPTGSYALALNLNEVNNRGVEISIQKFMSFSSSTQLSGFAGLCLLHTSTADTTPSLYISAHAKTLVNGGINFLHKKFRISSTLVYKSRNAVVYTDPNIIPVDSDYFLLNLRTEYLFSKAFNAYVEASNVFDNTYTDILGSRMPGRWLMGGVKIHFIK